MPKCEICGKDFDSKKELKEHVKDEHPEEVKDTMPPY